MENITTNPSVPGTTARPMSQDSKDNESRNDSLPNQPAVVSSSALHGASTTNDCLPSESAPFNSSSPDGTPSPVIEVVKTAKQLKREAQTELRKEKRKRRIRETISKEIGHEIDTDGEREYWAVLSAKLHAEEARRQALSPEARRRTLTMRQSISGMQSRLEWNSVALARCCWNITLYFCCKWGPIPAMERHVRLVSALTVLFQVNIGLL